ncbi:poly(U)-specific exoribonuclease, producing 3' uridine cyclic phosphate ends Mpn1 [Schizosaccharomyces osmophilus]|uniref:U6 snRNA phosphodiesterase 1 n=1 Tax=Schizosaccharomyces osmophilus TaxID=2545709 RepID=A0AAE9WFC3_9SCHI|nr:poly(U)-specific exoribonuclease, producing 3' uridine cyclic phosphate ends Mpn1 [Schizosaccharomyces osmophilus]WBW74241.1 poly(U)-specific exoribonuclease, producing 3' uridine cyclic phosphate ends Mpn1 [Schizosaccharomyces osmophilus]
MSLVPYDSSDTESSEESDANVKDVPKLPEFFHDLYRKRRKTFDSPIFHEGRKRTKAHVEGLWAVQIYLDVDFHGPHKQKIEDIIASQSEFRSLFISEYGVGRNLHLSLSEFFRIASDERKAAFTTWKQECQRLQQRIIKYTLQDVCLLFNDEKTRMFIVLKATFENVNLLRKLLEISDKFMKKFEGKELRKDFLPHVSIAWAHAKQGDFEAWASCDRENLRFIKLETLLKQIQSAMLKSYTSENNSIKMLMGNTVHSVNMQ